MPASALAAPQITITNPENGKTYTKGDPVAVSFTCTDATSCTATDGKGAPLANGAALDTTTLGPSYITVSASGPTGTSSAQATYNVAEAGSGGGGGDVPPTLAMTLGSPTTFAPFIPGVAQNYTATLAAQLLSTAGDATLSVSDASSVQTGHLVNGAFFLPAALQVAGAKPPPPAPQTAPPLVFAPVGGSAAPTTVLTYDGPINETDTLTFKQPIGSGDSLRTGPYSKTLTFTLSTTQP